MKIKGYTYSKDDGSFYIRGHEDTMEVLIRNDKGETSKLEIPSNDFNNIVREVNSQIIEKERENKIKKNL